MRYDDMKSEIIHSKYFFKYGDDVVLSLFDIF